MRKEMGGGLILLGLGTYLGTIALYGQEAQADHPNWWLIYLALIGATICLIAGLLTVWGVPYLSWGRLTGPPPWRNQIGFMSEKQIAHLEALEHERQGYVRRGEWERVKHVDDEIGITRDLPWEDLQDLSAAEPGEAPADSLVTVRYSAPSNPAVSARFLFPDAPVNRAGEIELVQGHGREVEWVIELTNHLRSVPRAYLTVLAPRLLIRSITALSTFTPAATTDYCEENMISDSDSGSIRFRGWFAPMMGAGNATEIRLKTTISFADRDIPIRIQVISDEPDEPINFSVYLPIRAVIAPDGIPRRGR